MNYIYWLSQIQHSEQSLVGNQLYILSQLLQREYPVLPGFVLSQELWQRFLAPQPELTAWILELSNVLSQGDLGDRSTLQSYAQRSRQLIDLAEFDEALTTEILANAQQLIAPALTLEPFIANASGGDLNGKGFWLPHTCNLHGKALTQTIKNIWSQLFSAKSLFYWQKQELTFANLNFSILVRPALDVRGGGVIELAPDLVKIRATWGDIQSVLLGDVDCDEYYLDRHTGELLSSKLGLKNYGYKLNLQDSHLSNLDCLVAYSPPETSSKTQVLDAEAIASLFQLTQNILAKQPQIEYLEWLAPQLTPDTNNPNYFFWRQFSDRQTKIIDLPDRANTPSIDPAIAIKPLLTGVAAAPGKIVGKILIVARLNAKLDTLAEDLVIVAKNITPHHLPLVKQAKGIITEVGGQNSHGAIIARELNIPAIVAAVDATNVLEPGMEILLDGDEGKIYPRHALPYLAPVHFSTSNLAIRQQPIATKLMVNISQVQSIAPSLKLPVDGVGLLRSELLLGDLLAGTTAQQWQSKEFQTEFVATLTSSLEQFLQAFAPRPVFYRSLDWTNEASNNFLVARRGTYTYRLEPNLFSLELQAIESIMASGYSNLKLILPFVRSIEEFKFCYRQLESLGLTSHSSFQVWIMAEVPSVIWLLPEYIQAGVAGIAIGTNDLTQLILGVDREQTHFARNGLNANHHAVQQAISQLIALARKNQIDCSICGQAPVTYPSSIEKLVSWGITTISVEPDAVNKTYQAIARAERKILLDSLKVF